MTEMIAGVTGEQLWKVARRHGVLRLRVFGSWARGEAGPDSDLDLLVNMEPGTSLLDMIGLQQALEDLVGGKVGRPDRGRDQPVREGANPGRSPAAVKDPTVFLRHILDAIARIETYAAAGQEAFRAEPMRQDAIVRNSRSSVKPSVSSRPSSNWLIHGYAVVELGIVWQTVTDDVPAMRRAVEGLLP